MINAENVLICIAVPFAISFIFTKGSARQLASAFLAGMVGCIFSAYVAGFIQLTSGYSAENTSIFLSPIIEESMKLSLILFCIYLYGPSGKRIESCSPSGLVPVSRPSKIAAFFFRQGRSN